MTLAAVTLAAVTLAAVTPAAVTPAAVTSAAVQELRPTKANCRRKPGAEKKSIAIAMFFFFAPGLLRQFASLVHDPASHACIPRLFLP